MAEGGQNTKHRLAIESTSSRIVPPYLPVAEALVYASGVASLWARLPLQAAFIAWVAGATRR